MDKVKCNDKGNETVKMENEECHDLSFPLED